MIFHIRSFVAALKSNFAPGCQNATVFIRPAPGRGGEGERGSEGERETRSRAIQLRNVNNISSPCLPPPASPTPNSPPPFFQKPMKNKPTQASNYLNTNSNGVLL